MGRVAELESFDSGHADEIRHTDLDAGEWVLNDVIQECQHSLKGIKHVRLDLDRSLGQGGTGGASMVGKRGSPSQVAFAGAPLHGVHFHPI